jgi:glycosyltransferase involved in cell wall biosynthesis
VRNPRGGGSERVAFELLRSLCARGHDVTWLASRVEGRPAREELDGLRVVRRGSELTTRLHAPRLARQLRPDLVVEMINTVPYLAPLWSRAPVLVFFHQLARDVWWYEAPKPLAALGWAAEPAYLRLYAKTPALVISRSTHDDLRRFGHRAPITTLPLAVDVPPVEELEPKQLCGRLVAVGRLTPSKRFDHAIRAVATLRRTHPAATLTLVGDGRERGALAALARDLRVQEAVVFAGRVSELEKARLLTDADVLVGTSVREGWGLTVTEAARRGTPSVVYDIPGFRDSVVDGRTGVLTRPEPDALAAALKSLFCDAGRYARLRSAALEDALLLSWTRSADIFEAAVLGRVGGQDPCGERG